MVSLECETLVALKLSKQAMPQELNGDPMKLGGVAVAGVAWRVWDVLFNFCKTVLTEW